ncbi:MAG: 5'-methylthioadenosine/adenosylhomocysteine nucleosidase [Lachnospiraceae bacterium]|nr:5'-methylthioadenosine/adenosylhomocysteine nucleosidase [Lachnospiraceae bacterium]
MKNTIGIIGAMNKEIEDLVSCITNLNTKTIGNIVFYEGMIEKNNVVVAKSGIGKVQAAMCATTMILNYNLKEIIHIGIAGVLDEELDIHDVAIADKVCQYDFDLTAFGLQKGEIEDLNTIYFNCDKKIIGDLECCAKFLNIHYKIGTIATGDQFVTHSDLKKDLVKNFDAIACEMEGAATGEVCFINKIPFAVVRAFSDKSDESFEESNYYKSKIVAADTATKLIKYYLREPLKSEHLKNLFFKSANF